MADFERESPFSYPKLGQVCGFSTAPASVLSGTLRKGEKSQG
jgi:hypothetical protein